MICWVRSAILAAFAVGRPSASSKPLVCRLCVPPSTAASAWMATRTMLFSGCWAVSVDPPVWVWKRSSFDFSSLAPNRSVMILAHMRRAARNLATSSKKLLWRVPEEADSRRRELVDVEAGVDRRLHVGDAVGQGEGDLLHRRRARLADVVAGDRDGVPLRDVLVAVGEDVGDDPHRLPRRVDVGAAGDVLLEDVVLDGAAELVGRHALLLGHQLVEQQQDGGRGVDRHRRRDLCRAAARRAAARMSSSESMATPTLPTSPSARGWSES